MDPGLYIAASGMLSEQTRQDQIANDLANASTPGYKGDISTQHAFGQLLLQNTENGQTIGTLGLGAQISVVSLTSPVKQGDTLFDGTAGTRPAGTSVVQGSLEGSGVDATRAMVDMLSSLRTYQSDQQAIQAIDDTLKKGIASGGA